MYKCKPRPQEGARQRSNNDKDKAGVKKLTDLAQQLASLYKHGRSIGVDFDTIADHLAVHVTVKDADLRYRYINLPGQVDRVQPSTPNTDTAPDLTGLMGSALGERLLQDDRRALLSPEPVVRWSEPRLRPDGQSERMPQIKVGLRDDHDQPLGVMDVAPISGLPSSDMLMEVGQMRQAIDLIAEVLGLMMRCDDEATLLERVCSVLVMRGSYLAAAVVPIDAERQQVSVPLSLAGDRSQLALPGPFNLDDPDWEHHPVVRAAEDGLCRVHPCRGTDDPGWPAQHAPDEAQALVALPLKVEDEVFAVLLLACDAQDGFAASQAVLMQRMADELSLGLELLRSKVRLVAERRQRDIHLRQQLLTSQRLSLATQSADVGIWEWDIQRGTVTLDERVAAQLGLPSYARTLPTATLQQWTHTEDQSLMIEALDNVAHEGQPRDVTVRLTPPDGRQRVLKVHMSALREDGPASGAIQGVLGATVDLTDRTRHTRQLRELDAKLRLATEATGVGLWELQTEDLTVLLDARSRQIYGLNEEAGALELDAWLGWVHPAQRQDLRRRLLASLRHPTVGQLECALTPPDGRLRRVLINWASTRGDDGEVRQLVGTQVDVTERRRTEARSEQTLHRLALMAGATGVGRWTYELHSGFRFDEAMYRLLGVTQQPLPASAWLMEMGLANAQREALELALITADDDLEVSLEWQGLDGVTRQIIWLGTVDRDARRTVIRGEGLCIDVTVQHHLQAVTQAGQTLSAPDAPDLTEMAARVGRELRAPLNALIGFIQLMRNQPRDRQAAQVDYLHDVEQAGWHLLDVIHQALDLSRIDSAPLPAPLGPVALKDLMGELLPLLEPQSTPRQVRIVAWDLGTWPSVRADTRRLRQALMYLLGRAVQHSPRYGQVVVSATRLSDGRVQLAIRDQGPTLDAVQRARLFEPQLGDTEPRGADGLSAPDMRLTVARQAIEAMGGSIEALAPDAGGTELRLTLMPAPVASAGASLSSEGLQAATGGTIAEDATVRGRMLYVEDNPSNTLLIRECMALRPGVDLVIAGTVHEGLQALKQAPFDFALLDLQLPDGDGYTVLRRLRETHGRRAACVALTASAMLNERNRALEAGFDAFWTKPLNLAEFLASVDRAMSGQTIEP